MRKPLAFAALLVACSCSGNDAPREMTAEQVAEELKAMKIQPGQWTATTEVVGVDAPVGGDVLKQMVGQKSSKSDCVTPEQAAKPSAAFLAVQQTSNCTYRDWSLEGGRIQGTMTCDGGQIPGQVVMTMTGAYASTRYDLDMNMKTAGLPGGAALTVKAKSSGRRTGECSAT